MKLVVGFLGFWRDLIIGDSWPIAAGICLLMAGGIEVLRLQLFSIGVFAILLGAAVMVLVSVIILVEAAATRRSG